MGRSEESKEKRREYCKKYSKENKEKRYSINKEWRDKNKDKIAVLNQKRHISIKELFDSGEKERAKEKRCSLCHTIKPAIEFYLSNTNNDGLHGWCKTCSDIRTKENSRKRLGCTPEAFKTKFEEQGYCCEVCKSKDSGKQDFHLDHSHKTGEIRGILCGRCNKVLGMVEENIEILERLKTYLENYNEDKY